MRRQDAILAALVATFAGAAQAEGSRSDAVKTALAEAVARCWMVDPGNPPVAVTLGYALDRSGRIAGEVRLLAPRDASEAGVGIAYEAARRAVLRCQGAGYALPAAEYDLWREVEMTFDAGGGAIW